MKKIMVWLLAATLVAACFVACEKEKDKEKKPTEQPTETQFNTGTPVSISIIETQQKSGRYDAKIIYDAAYKWHHNGVTSELFVWHHWRDTVEEKFAIRGDLAIKVPDGITPVAPGAFAYWRDNILVVALNEDGSVWDIGGLHKDKFINHMKEDGSFNEDTDEEIALWREYGEDWDAHKISKVDTVAYIPNSVMDSMQPLMEQAFYDKDWNRCYDLFKNGYEFIPITGTEYMELVRQGKN